MTAVERSIGAEVRAIEEGHRAFAAGDRFEVISDRGDGVRYQVTVADVGGLIAFGCDHRQVRRYATSATTEEPGLLPCKHAAVVAHRLEREGLARFDGDRWQVTDRARQLTASAGERGYGLDSDDPFHGLPR